MLLLPCNHYDLTNVAARSPVELSIELTMPLKFCPTNSERSSGPVYRCGISRLARISLASSAHASNARDSDKTRVLSQSKRM